MPHVHEVIKCSCGGQGVFLGGVSMFRRSVKMVGTTFGKHTSIQTVILYIKIAHVHLVFFWGCGGKWGSSGEVWWSEHLLWWYGTFLQCSVLSKNERGLPRLSLMIPLMFKLTFDIWKMKCIIQSNLTLFDKTIHHIIQTFLKEIFSDFLYREVLKKQVWHFSLKVDLVNQGRQLITWPLFDCY